MGFESKSKRLPIPQICGIAISAVLIIIIFSGRFFSGWFNSFANFFLGSFGMCLYGILAGIIVACALSIAGKKVLVPKKYVASFCVMFFVLILLVHLYTTYFVMHYTVNNVQVHATYAEYVDACYHYYGSLPTFGGVIFGSVVYALDSVLTVWGASVLLFLIFGLTIYFVGDFFHAYATGEIKLSAPAVARKEEPKAETEEVVVNSEELEREKARNILFQHTPISESGVDASTTRVQSVDRSDVAPQSTLLDDAKFSSDILFGGATEQQQPATKRGNSFFDNDDDDIFTTQKTYSDNNTDDFIVHDFFTQQPTKQEQQPAKKPAEQKPQQTIQQPEVVVEEQRPVEEETYSAQDFFTAPAAEFSNEEIDITDLYGADDSQPAEQFTEEQPAEEVVYEEPAVQEAQQPVEAAIQQQEVVDEQQEEVAFDDVEEYQPAEEQPQIHKYLEYEKPPVELLEEPQINPDFFSEDRTKSAEAIVRKLAVFGIKLEAVEPIVGPSVTRYQFRVLSEKTKMSEFAKFTDDIKSCLEADDDIVIQAPVPGTSLVGIEVANKIKASVGLRTVLESDAFKNAKGRLVFAVGQELSGKMVVCDLAEMPHLLVAGSTGSGKSVSLNCLIVSMMYRYSPEYLRFIMIDPKFVELSRYNGAPHMLVREAITNMSDSLAAMDYLFKEMEARYQLFVQTGVGDIKDYNKKINPETTQKLPYLVLIVDELADLMEEKSSRDAFESKLKRLAAKSRACGIHIVLATQRPSVDVITGVIKANLPGRMALKVIAPQDSATILGRGGAEKLLGKGDMLLMIPGKNDNMRVQSAYVSNDEIRNLIQYLSEQNELYFEDKIADEIYRSKKEEETEVEDEPSEASVAKEPKAPEIDPLCKKVLRFWIERNQKKASIASIQRNFSVGFNRAGKIFATLEEMGCIEELKPSEPSSKPRKVTVDLIDLDSLFPNLED